VEALKEPHNQHRHQPEAEGDQTCKDEDRGDHSDRKAECHSVFDYARPYPKNKPDQKTYPNAAEGPSTAPPHFLSVGCHVFLRIPRPESRANFRWPDRPPQCPDRKTTEYDGEYEISKVVSGKVGDGGPGGHERGNDSDQEREPAGILARHSRVLCEVDENGRDHEQEKEAEQQGGGA
jgi:hypothetical protein